MRIGLNAHLLSFESTYRQAGVSKYIEALVRHLPSVAPDDDLIVFTGPEKPPASTGFHPGITWHHSILPTASPNVRIAWEQTVATLGIPRSGVDLLHAPVNVISMGVRVPQVVTVHDLAFHHYPEQYPGMKQRYLRTMTRASVRRATLVIAVSEATRQDIIRIHDVDPERVVVVPNGVDDFMRPLPETEVAAFREQQNLPEHFFLFLGTLQPRKNVEGLVRAFASVSMGVDWPLVIAGAKGWQYEQIFRLVEELGLTSRVRFAGHVPGEHLPLWYNAATMLVYPSRYEGFGLPLLEAMACGTAVIGSTASSLPEVVGDAGLLVDPDDIPGLAESMLRLASDSELRQQLEQRGLERSTSFTWQETARLTAGVYHRALAGR